REHLDRDRSTLWRAGEPISDLELAALDVARVAEGRLRALAALQVAGGDVVENEATLAQETAGERPPRHPPAGERPRPPPPAPPPASSSPSVVSSNWRVADSFDPGRNRRWQIKATARSRSRLRSRPSIRSSPSPRSVPKTAATWPCGSERSIVNPSPKATNRSPR